MKKDLHHYSHYFNPICLISFRYLFDKMSALSKFYCHQVNHNIFKKRITSEYYSPTIIFSNSIFIYTIKNQNKNLKIKIKYIQFLHNPEKKSHINFNKRRPPPLSLLQKNLVFNLKLQSAQRFNQLINR